MNRTGASVGRINTGRRVKGWSIEISNLTLDENLIQVAIKKTHVDTDEQALLFINKTGLIRVMGEAAATPTLASLAYVGTTLTIQVDASITALLPVGSPLRYGIQSITPEGKVQEIYGGRFTLIGDIVRSTS